VQKFNVDLSGRYDDYSDVGNTANPKIALEWEVINGLKLRANTSTSFVAPSQRSVGNPALGGLNSLSRATPNTTSAQIPTSVFPNIIGDPGCAPGSALCQINSTVQGIYRYTGNPDTQPEKGRAWNLGVDYAPDFIPGLSLSVTLFNNKLLGGVTSPPLNSIINNASLNSRLNFCNPGAPCTQQQISNFIGNVPITQALPSSVYYLYDQTQTNVFNLYLQGLDIGVNYSYATDSWGTFGTSLAMTQFTKFDQNYNGSPRFSILNTSGYATQFASIATQGRINLNWNFEGFGTSVYANYVGGYRNWSTTTNSPVLTHLVDGQSVPYAGGDPVKSTVTIDLHVSYDLMHMGFDDLGDSQIYVDVRNLFDTDPPFYNSSTGYDPFAGNPLKRVTSVGFRMKY
jgi:iron complex outermembrane receptor protein